MVQNFGAGAFTVGEAGKVSFDYLFDGSTLQGEVAIFNLEGMENYSTEEFIRQAALRALGNSPDFGYVVIAEQTEKAALTGSLESGISFNTENYSGTKTFDLRPGSRFGIMLLPQGNIQDLLANPNGNNSQNPVFSIAATNPGESSQFAKLINLQADDNIFLFEETLLTKNADRDYDDLVFRVIGASGEAPSYNELVSPEKNLLNTLLGSVLPSPPQPREYAIDLEKDLGLVNEPVQVGEGVWFLGKGIAPSDLKLVKPNNINAAYTSDVDKLWNNGGLGLNLDGNGLTVGVWEAGNDWRIRNTHQELTGRVTIVDTEGDVGNHATHVAGTIAATGIIDTNRGLDGRAHGMANRVNLRSYSAANDTIEMQRDAALLVATNHSYGNVLGWNFAERTVGTRIFNQGVLPDIDVWLGNGGDFNNSRIEDVAFGKYNQDAQTLDEILFNNPNLLSVWSAGNDRDNRFFNQSQNNTYVTHFATDPGIPGFNWVQAGAGWYQVATNILPAPPSDGNGGTGYDSLPHQKTAKNTLVVGSVNDTQTQPNVRGVPSISNFSSWGPTDDGRVKPDVVAKGQDIFSSWGDGDGNYLLDSGTSMAAPVVTGAAVLLTQHYQNLFNRRPRSATTKNLLIHTANDFNGAGGLPGPDYQSGWGLIDARTAANFLTQTPVAINPVNTLQENNYTGTQQTLNVVSNGVEPLKVTIVWTDPAPTTLPGAALDDNRPVLVNDLDLSLTAPDGTTIHLPWTLDPANPAASAQRNARNRIDNVEQVLIDTPVAGTYTINISHTGTLTNSLQDYSILTSSRVARLFPNPNDSSQTSLYVGSTQGNDEIKVTRQGETGIYDVLLNNQSQASFSPTGSIIMYGQNGDDRFDAPNSSLPVTMYGNAGNDNFQGGFASLSMFGGIGNDIYNVDTANDFPIESPNEGIDIVNSSVNNILAANVENLNLIEGTSALNGTGNDIDNLINGNSANNLIEGFSGSDRLYGFAGNDTINGGDGDDWIFSGVGNESVSDGMGRITGIKGSDILTGGNGSDYFAYNNITEGGDLITDFTVGSDKIVVQEVLNEIVNSSGFRSSNPLAEVFSFKQAGSTVVMQIDADGTGGLFKPVPFLLFKDANATALNNVNNFIV